MKPQTVLIILSILLIIAFFALSANRETSVETNVSTIATNATQTTTAEICLYSCPSGAPATNRVIKRPIYILSNNGKTKFADWVAYNVTPKTIGHTQKRVWHRDPDLPADETLSPDDYKGAHEALHVDRGHQAPLASLTGTPFWDMADDLSNITPQSTELNEGAWEKLEQAERNLALRKDIEVHVLTGPLYKRSMPKLPHSHLGHSIPSGYWKIVAVKSGQDFRAAAFIMDQELSRDADYCAQATTIQAIEAETNLKFFSLAPTEILQNTTAKKVSLLSDLNCQN